MSMLLAVSFCSILTCEEIMITSISGYTLWVAVSLNGQVWEAIPNVYQSMDDCVQAQQLYTKEIVLESKCFKGTFVVKDSK